MRDTISFITSARIPAPRIRTEMLLLEAKTTLETTQARIEAMQAGVDMTGAWITAEDARIKVMGASVGATKVPAGRFPKAIKRVTEGRVSGEFSGMPVREGTITEVQWFAPNVGMVRSERTLDFKVHDGTAYSTTNYTMSVDVTSVNDAPVLDNTGNMTLTNIIEDDANPARRAAENRGDAGFDAARLPRFPDAPPSAGAPPPNDESGELK